MNRFDLGCRDNRISRRGVLRSLAAGSSLLLPGILSQLLAQEAGAAPAGADPSVPLQPTSR